jgi:hypothetical protein
LPETAVPGAVASSHRQPANRLERFHRGRTSIWPGVYRRQPRCGCGVEGAIADVQAPFVSRGDKSGTDALEHRLWRVAEIDPVKAGGGSWYRDIGGSMGAALNTAQAMGAYTISDRGTWLSFGNKGDLTVLIEGDPRLLNRYDVILLNPAKHPVPKQALAQRFAQWLVSPEGQAAIGGYEVAGEQLFHPSAAVPKWKTARVAVSQEADADKTRRKAMPKLTLRIDFGGLT